VLAQGALDMLAPNWPENDHLHDIDEIENRSILALHFWHYLGQLIDQFKLPFLLDDFFSGRFEAQLHRLKIAHSQY
jgi:hypothetical protein